MSSIQEPNLSSLGAPTRRPTSDTPADAPSAEPSTPATLADVLDAKSRPEAPANPGDLVAKIKALQTPPEPPAVVQPDSVPYSQRVRRTLDPQGVPDRARDYVAPILNLAIGILTSPRYAVKRVQGLIRRTFHVVRGVGKAREFAQDLREARQAGRGAAFVRGQFRFLKWRSTRKAKQAVTLAKAHKGRNLLKLFSRRTPSEIAKNKGLLGFFREARAAGASRLQALWKGFTRTIETGGNMPKVAQEAAEMGGKWGKALTWTGRIGRLAPLLNVPLAIFDVKEAWNTFRHPNATTQDRVSKGGQAALTSAAAGLAVAGFLTPPPINAALLTASGVVGVASTVWGVATSEVAVNAIKRLGGFFGGLGRRLGLG